MYNGGEGGVGVGEAGGRRKERREKREKGAKRGIFEGTKKPVVDGGEERMPELQDQGKSCLEARGQDIKDLGGWASKVSRRVG